MATLRDQILDAVVAALNTDTPAPVPQARRRRFSSLEADALPLIDVVPLAEQVAPMGGARGPAVKRTLLIGVRCWASGEAPEVAADAMVAWVVKALAGNRLGGLIHDIEETETTWAADAMDAVYGVAEVQFAVQYHSKTNDAEVK